MTAPAILYAAGGTERNFYDQLRPRLDTAIMREYTLGPGRVYIADDRRLANPPAGETETRPWGRVVIIPMDVPIDAGAEMVRAIRWTVKYEVNDAWESGANFPAILAGMHREAYRQLQYFRPDAVSHVVMTSPCQIVTAPLPIASYDDERGVLFASTVFRADLGASGD